MPIFVGASGIIPELLNNWHNFWQYYIYNNIYPKQIITALIPNVQNKYLWAPKNIGLIFISVQYFQRATWTFSWTLLEHFLFGSFLKMISEGFTNPHFKFKWNLNMMHTWLASLGHTRTRDVITRSHLKESRPEIQGSTERKWGYSSRRRSSRSQVASLSEWWDHWTLRNLMFWRR